MTAAEASTAVVNSAADKNKILICGHNLHSWYLYETDALFRSCYESARFVLLDGFPIWLLCQLRAIRSSRRLGRTRCGSTDWIFSEAFMRSGLRVALIGSTTESVSAAAERLRAQGDFDEVGAWDGFEDVLELVRSNFDSLRRFNPDVVLVGLGMPLQERFVTENWHDMPVAVYAAVGGAIDQISGAQPLAPRWMGRYGLEWIYRLSKDPHRLGRRYLIEPVKLLRVLVIRRSQRSGLGGSH